MSTRKKQLAESVKTALANDLVLRAKLSTKTGKHLVTIQRWIEADSDALTTELCREVYREHLGITDDKLFDEVA
jgi:hypothetical protein